MPIIKSAMKQLRKSIKAKKSNTARKDETRKTVKTLEKFLKEKKTDEAKKKLQEAYSKIDRLAKKNLIHKNTAARKKARLTKNLNKAMLAK